MRAMPEDVQDVFGRLLLDVQYGERPPGARPFGEGLPSDIMKLVEDSDGDTYRVVKTYLGNVSVRAEPFDAVAIDLSLLWISSEPKQAPQRRARTKRRKTSS